MNLIDLLDSGSHIFAVYPNKEIEIEECFSFLKGGLDKNESVIIILEKDSQSMLYKKLEKELGIYNTTSSFSIENGKDIVISSPSQWYHFHYGDFRADRFLNEWESRVSKSKEKGKRGLRVFVEADAYVIEKFENALIKFDELLESYLSYPITTIYAYKREDIVKMNSQQNAMLNLNHGLVWTKRLSSTNNGGNSDNNNNSNVNSNDDCLLNTSFRNHYICLSGNGRTTKDSNLLLNDLTPKDDRELFLNKTMIDSLSEFINDGMIKGERCIYATARIKNESVSEHLLSEIIDCNKNVKLRNFQLIDLSHHYISALCNDFAPFEQFVKYLRKQSMHSATGKLRFVCDCAGTLFRYKHFEQCVELENWWLRNLPKNTIRLGLYPAYLFDQPPYRYNVKPLLSTNTTSLIISSFNSS